MKHYLIVFLILLAGFVRAQTIDPGLKISNGLKSIGSNYRLYPRADSLKLANIPSGGSSGGVSSYTALTDRPILFSGAYSDLSGRPTLFSGNYADLTNRPTLPGSYFSGAYTDLTGKPALFSGAYVDLTGKPTLFSGAYADLTGKPTIPTSNTAQTNDAGYQTASQVSSAISAGGFATTSFASSAGNLTAGTLPIARLPALSGDITSTAGSGSLTLNSIVTAGSVGSATTIPVLTYDAKGRITGASSTTFSAGSGSFTEAQVRSTTLTGYSTATNRAVLATDNIVTALGLVQAQLNTAAVSINPVPAALTYGATTSYPYSLTQPNAKLTVTGNTTISLTGTNDGDSGFLRITKTAGSEVVTFPGLPPGPLKTTAGAVDYVSWINNAGTLEWLLEGSYVDISGKLNTSTYNANTPGYQTASQVSSAISAGGFLTTTAYNSNTPGYQTAAQVSSAITAAGLVTTSTFNSYTTATASTLSGKQAALVSGTNIKTVNGTSLLGSGDLVISGGGGSAYTQFVTSQRALGGQMKYQSDIGGLLDCINDFDLGAGKTYLYSVSISQSDLLTGVGVAIVQQGAYTGVSGDAIALYSVGSTTLTKVASSAFSSTTWQAAAGHLKIAFSSTYTAPAGEYYIAISHDRSAVTTSPKLLSGPELRVVQRGLPGAKLISAFVYGNTLPTTINVGDMNEHQYPSYCYVY